MNKKDSTILKKGVHFNTINEEDKLMMDFIEKNNINFSSLAKQLLLQYINEQILTKHAVEDISRKVAEDVIESKLVSDAFENKIRTILIESMASFNISMDNNPINKNTSIDQAAIDQAAIDQAAIIIKAVGNYSEDDLKELDF